MLIGQYSDPAVLYFTIQQLRPVYQITAQLPWRIVMSETGSCVTIEDKKNIWMKVCVLDIVINWQLLYKSKKAFETVPYFQYNHNIARPLYSLLP